MSNGVGDEYITVEEAASRLGVTTRQVNRYGGGDRPKLRTARAGRRILYHRGDVDALGDELGAHRRLAPAQPTRADLIPAGEMLDYLRERDTQLGELQAELARLSQENGALRARLEDVTTERDRVRGLLEAAERPWWRFWTKDRPS